MGEEEPGLGLDEVLAALRHDLVSARDQTDGDDYGLGVREVEIELSVQVSRTRSAEGSVGAKWFVLSGDAGGRAASERTDAHRIRLTLGPTGHPGPPSGGEAGAEEAGVGGVGQGAAAETIGAPIAGEPLR